MIFKLADAIKVQPLKLNPTNCFVQPAILFFVVVCSSLFVVDVDASQKTKPNIVIVMADDLGYRDISCYGCIDFKTPNIDALAKQGIRCTNGYVSHPYCSPSRAGLLSGKYQQSFGHEHNPPYDEGNDQIGIDVATTLLPAHLKNSGYRTALIGKWHLGAGKPFRPHRRGFAEFYGFLGGGHDYFKVKQNGRNYNSPMWHNGKPTDDKLTYLTDDLTSQAESFIRKNHDNPFCLLVMYNAPHAPDQVTDQYLARVANIQNSGRRKYAALVQGVDEGVKRIRQQLKENNLTEKTLFIFLSDNGGRRKVSDNRPLRGNKGWLHEGGIRVPLIISMPGTLPKNKTYQHPVIALDLMPTALALADVVMPEQIDGINLLPFLNGDNNQSPHENLFWRVSGGEGYAVRHNHWKLVRDIGMQKPELYNLDKDIGENHDLSDNDPQLVKKLQRIYNKWSGSLEKPRWTEGHTQNTLSERNAARRAGSRQYPMSWVKQDN